MTNGGGEKGSSSSNPNLIRPTPQRSTGGGRSGVPPPPPPPPPPRSRALPLQRSPLIMGVPGVSAFTPYPRARPPPPPPPPAQPQPQPHDGSSAPPHGSSSSPTGPGIGSHGFAGLVGAQAVAVGGSGHGGAPLRIGGNPASRKRGRESGGGNQGEGGGDPVQCSICAKEFLSSKALFGHMRSHPGRGWKGAHPPPAFRAEEEFADLRPLFQPPVPAPAAGGGEAGEGGASGDGEGGARAEEQTGPAAEGERKAEEEEGGSGGGGGGRFIPDLNA